MSEQYASLSGGSATEIAASVERAVASGELPPGARLPAVRALASSLGVSPTTVAAALSELRRRGVVVSRPRSGTRISERPPLRASAPATVVHGTRDLALGNPDPSLLPDLTAAFQAELEETRRGATAPGGAVAAGGETAPDRATAPGDEFAFGAAAAGDETASGGAATPGSATAPGGTAAPRASWQRLYGESPIDPGLATVARAALEADGIAAERLVVVNGALDGIERALAAHLVPGDQVAVEDPGWPGVLDLARALGLRLAPVAVDERGMLPDALEAALRGGARAALVTPRGHNPLGAAFDAERAAALRELLADVLVIEDDHLGPVAGVPWHSVAGRSGRWATVRSVSKWLGPDLRCAVLAGDALTLARVEGRMSLGPGWVSSILQRLTARLWADPEVEALVEQASAVYASRRAAMVDALAAHGLRAFAPSGLNVWIPVPDEDTAVRALLAAGVSVAAGAPFRLEAPPAIRITVAALRHDEAPALATALAAAVNPPHRTRAG